MTQQLLLETDLDTVLREIDEIDNIEQVNVIRNALRDKSKMLHKAGQVPSRIILWILVIVVTLLVGALFNVSDTTAPTLTTPVFAGANLFMEVMREGIPMLMGFWFGGEILGGLFVAIRRGSSS